MFRSSMWAAVACLAMVSIASAQENTAQIKAVQPIAANTDTSASSTSSPSTTATISDDCGSGC